MTSFTLNILPHSQNNSSKPFFPIQSYRKNNSIRLPKSTNKQDIVGKKTIAPNPTFQGTFWTSSLWELLSISLSPNFPNLSLYKTTYSSIYNFYNIWPHSPQPAKLQSKLIYIQYLTTPDLCVEQTTVALQATVQNKTLSTTNNIPRSANPVTLHIT